MNINQFMVRAGAAWVYEQYNTDPVLPVLQNEARQQKRGLWSDADPVPPWGNDSNLLIVFYVQIMPDDFVMQLHRF